MKITFKQDSEQQITILGDGVEIGQIFTPSSLTTEGSIQVCGFEEAFDLWGCGIYGEMLEPEVFWVEIESDAPIYEQERTGDLKKLFSSEPWIEKHYMKKGIKWYRREQKQRFRMKKDIQLLFKPYKNITREQHMQLPNDFIRVGGTCHRCFSYPCICELMSNTLNPFLVKNHNHFTEEELHRTKADLMEEPLLKENNCWHDNSAYENGVCKLCGALRIKK